MTITTRDDWTGKRGLEISDGEYRFVLVGFGMGLKWRLRRPKGWMR